ncbi:Fis1p [Sporobolomyces koalae]|uniref:Fis1p n=1 Tax=Sporobolomyces koalae TaxID=500713 RepID=UPI003181B2CB
MPSDVLPGAIDAASPLSDAELAVLRTQYVQETEKGYCSIQTKFNFAWGSVKSENRIEVAQGVQLLMEIYRQEPERRRECLYFLAVGHYKLGNYPESKRYNSLLLDKEPNNFQAQSLNALIEKAVAKEGYVGMAIAGGVAAAAGLVFTALMAGNRRR